MRTRMRALAVIAAVSVVAGLAVIADGFDSQEIPPVATSVWVARDSGQYARVNTDLAEIDTVRLVQDPAGVVQSGNRSIVFSQGFRQQWPVDAAFPLDLLAPDSASAAEEPAGKQNTPPGTRQVVTAGDWVAYLTDSGAVFVSSFSAEGEVLTPIELNPFIDEPVSSSGEESRYVATAMALSDVGEVLTYSSGEAGLRRFDAATATPRGGMTALPDPPAEDARVELALLGSDWVLSAPAEGAAWVSGANQRIEMPAGPDALLQSSAPGGDAAYVADSAGLVKVSVSERNATRVLESAGTPAAPVVVAGETFAAWLSPNAGKLWSSLRGEVPLTVAEGALDQSQTIVPAFHSNGDRAVLAEKGTGLLWRAPDGKAVPLEQWSADDDEQVVGTTEVEDAAEQEPPVAVADSFGVRTGELVALPLLLNDYDPNKKDVLSIVPESVSGGLDTPEFGELSLISNNQAAAVLVTATEGSAQFSYAVTDGMAQSEPVTVTLTVAAPEIDSAPVWCGVEACQQSWPTPQIAPGGTVRIPVTEAWVDPEGDAVVLTDARRAAPEDPVSVVPTADGQVAVRHNDPNAGGSAVTIIVTVSDSRGNTVDKELIVQVTESPTLVAAPAVFSLGVGERTTVQVGEQVTGGSGSYRLVDAVDMSPSSALTVVPNTAAAAIQVSASAVGDYFVSYTVQDAVTQAEQSAVLRFAVVEDAPLSLPPLTAFVRSNEDTTIDVLEAAQNTSESVLTVTGVETSDTTLSVSAVGQARVRVSGTTESGEPGRVGTARVTIGDGGSRTATGQVTVFLVPDATSTLPIAVPDSVTVRAGAQIDIPVLANDLSPRGERLMVHPTVTGSGAPGELAFASHTALRYLAPSEPGTYQLGYTTFLEGQPDRMDAATVTVTVIAPGDNRPPAPPTLVARAIAGQTVSIPVEGFGMDPDGDSVVLEQVSAPQPGFGVAAISADGSAIQYTAPRAGVAGGQVSFGYSMRDSGGESGDGVVRVGVVAGAISDSTPITYSDYVRVQQGSPDPVIVFPMRDDTDPAQGTLELVEVVPNAPATEGNPEYARIAELLDASTSLPDGRVALRAGEVLGTHSYVYTVQSSVSTSTAQGLIVVEVTDSPAPDGPIVADTTVTAKERRSVESGIDVVTGKVQWQAGDVSGMSLSVWGKAASTWSVRGNSIVGPAPVDGALVPFSLAGTSGGKKVETFGFLRIPAFDDMRIQVKPKVKPQEVEEEKSVEFPIMSLLDLEESDRVEVDAGRPFVTQRANASCTAAGGDRVRYEAGREAPWSDRCTVPVRLAGQDRWTIVSVPIVVIPKDPQPLLQSVTRTISPGQTESIDLGATLTQWEGGRAGDVNALDFATRYGGGAFTVVQQGNSVSIEARADAKPGTRDTVAVTVTAFGGLSANITLVVGIAPNDAPRGATLSHSCDVSQGSCTITAAGVAGEYDPFAGKPGAGLTLKSIGQVGCPVASVSVANSTQLVATWPSGKPAGGTCVVPITVQDAQGRTGPGQVTIDVLGFPAAPASVTTAAYSATGVTLSVALGEAAGAHPALSRVSIWEDGRAVQASCAPAGPGSHHCTVSGMTNGQERSFTARAENSVGVSSDTTPVRTWAYDAPHLGSVTAVQAREGATRESGKVRVTVDVADDAAQVILTSAQGEQTVSAEQREHTLTLPVGQQTITATAISRFRPPIGAGGNTGASKQASLQVAGTPFVENSGSASVGSTSATFDGLSWNRNNSQLLEDVRYGASRGEADLMVCTLGADGKIQVSGDVIKWDSPTIPNLEQNTHYALKACVSNGYGIAESQTHPVFTFNAPPAPSGTLTYSIKVAPKISGATAHYKFDRGPDVSAAPGLFRTTYFYGDGGWDTGFDHTRISLGSPASVKFCYRGDQMCSAPAPIVAATAPVEAKVEFPSHCMETPTAAAVQVPGIPQEYWKASVVVDKKVATYTVKWLGAFAALDDAVYNGCAIVPDSPEPTTPPTTPPTTSPTTPPSG